MAHLYDKIGGSYQNYRRPDPRIHESILRALGQAEMVVNVGAGTGSYEPSDRFVVAVEPSMTMIRQRRMGNTLSVQSSATHLPFLDGAFDAALAVLTVHHWPDQTQGLDELARVTKGRIVIITWDPSVASFWLVNDYFPEIMEVDSKIFPTIEDFSHALGHIEAHTLPIPHDCVDGFLGAYWRRPHAYLDPGIRSGISTFSKVSSVEDGLARLSHDLEDGTWERCYGELLSQTELDLGYRIVISKRR